MTADPLRTTLVAPSAKRAGGGDVWLHLLLAGIGAHGISASVVFEAGGELVEHARRHGHAATILDEVAGDRSAKFDHLVAPLARLISASSPGVTVFWSPRAQVYGAAAHRDAGQPGRTAWVQHVMPSRYWLHQAASAAPSDQVICVSRGVQASQVQLYPASRTTVVHPGVSVPGRMVNRSVARRALGHDGSTPLIGVVGRLEPWKGQDIAVRMLAELPARACALVLIGERRSATWPQFGAQVETLVYGLGLSAAVIFAGHIRDVPAYLPALDVLVCASREEGFGLAVAEAMAVGVPVVATCCGGPEDLIEDGVTGLLAPREDPAALAGQVRRLLADPALAARLVARAGILYRRQFTATAAVARFATVIRELASRPEAGRPLPSRSMIGHPG